MIAGLDIGTTGCKVTVYDKDGNYLYRAYQDYPASRTLGEHEVNAEAISLGVMSVLKKAAGKYPEIEAIGITSFGESFVMLDQNDLPIRSVMLYTDPRGAKECEELIEIVGKEKITEITGATPHSMYSLPKIMWVKKNEPENYAKVKKILLMEDYIIYLLTGNAVIDYSLATRSMAFNIKNLCWSEELLQAAQIERGLFSKAVITGTVAGCISEKQSKELGLSQNVKIIPVGHDQVAAGIGTGVFLSEDAVDGAGTVECITPVFDGIPDIGVMSGNNYSIVPYAISGKYVTYAFSYTGGALIDWFVKSFAKEEKRISKDVNKSVYEIIESGMKDGPTGILVLPHFAGAATPYMDGGSKGAVVGLTIEHTISDLYKSMMEGVVYEMRLNLERLKSAGIEPKKLKASGGGAASSVWMQMKADILNIPIVSLGNVEAGAAGCAMLAGIAAGYFETLEEAAKKLVSEKAVYYPRKEVHDAYQKHYERYEKLYEAVRPLV